LLGALFASFGSARDLAAQGASAPPAVSLSPGARIRVTSPGTDRFEGTFRGGTADSIQIGLENGASVALATSSLTRLELSAGVRRQGRRGAAIGLLVGAGVGGAIGLATYRIPECEPSLVEVIFCSVIEKTSREVTVIADATLVGTAGAVVGALIGHAGRETWVPVSLASPVRRVGFVLRSDRLGSGLGMSIGF
jgi:hypothetical protein